MLDNITPKVAQGGSLFAEEGTFESACGLFSVCCFFLHVFVCLSNLLSLYPALHASASFWDESKSGKIGPFFHLSFPSFLLSYLHLFHHHDLHPKLQPPFLNPRNKLTNLPLSNTHKHTIHH